MDRQDQAGGRGAWRRVHPILQTSLFFEYFCSIITCASMSVCCLEGGGGGGVYAFVSGLGLSNDR